MSKLSKKERKILRKAAKIMKRLADGDKGEFAGFVRGKSIWTTGSFADVGIEWQGHRHAITQPDETTNEMVTPFSDTDEIEYTQQLDIPLLIHDNPMPNIRDGMHHPPSIRRLGKDGWV